MALLGTFPIGNVLVGTAGGDQPNDSESDEHRQDYHQRAPGKALVSAVPTSPVGQLSNHGKPREVPLSLRHTVWCLTHDQLSQGHGTWTPLMYDRSATAAAPEFPLAPAEEFEPAPPFWPA